MSHFEETTSPHEDVSPTGAPVEPRVSVRDADDQIAATTSTGSPRGATTQNPCVLPWRPTVTSRFIPYATNHSCGCATGSAETSGLCHGCSEQVASMTATGQDPDDDYPWVFVDDDTHSPEDFHDDRHNGLADALEAPKRNTSTRSRMPSVMHRLTTMMGTNSPPTSRDPHPYKRPCTP